MMGCVAAAGLAFAALSSSQSSAAPRTPRAAAAASGKITFSVPTVVDPIHTFG
jgi:hypothetical protein